MAGAVTWMVAIEIPLSFASSGISGSLKLKVDRYPLLVKSMRWRYRCFMSYMPVQPCIYLIYRRVEAYVSIPCCMRFHAPVISLCSPGIL